MKKILRNMAKCPDGTIIESKHRHDYVEHTGKDGKYSMVDGGTEYIRRGGVFEDMTVYDNGKHTTRRENLRWGVNYTKDMKLLPKTKWMFVKDLSTEHIQAILDGGHVSENLFYKEVFEEELIFREL